MRRRHFINKAALWGGGLMLAGSWLPRLRTTETAVFGAEFTKLSSSHQDFLRQFSEQLQVELASCPEGAKWMRTILRPVAILRQDQEKDVLVYRNASRQFVIVDKHKEDYRVRFLDYLPKHLA